MKLTVHALKGNKVLDLHFKTKKADKVRGISADTLVVTAVLKNKKDYEAFAKAMEVIGPMVLKNP